MKHEKVCINKSVGLIVLILAILLSVVLLANYTNNQKVANNSRAATKLPGATLLNKISSGEAATTHCSVVKDANGDIIGTAGDDCEQCGAEAVLWAADSLGENSGCSQYCKMHPQRMATLCPNLLADKRKWECSIVERNGQQENDGQDCDKCGRGDGLFAGTYSEVDEACKLFCKDHPGDAPAMCPVDWTVANIEHKDDPKYVQLKDCKEEDFTSATGKAVNAEGLKEYSAIDDVCNSFSKYQLDDCAAQEKDMCVFRRCAGRTELQEFIRCEKSNIIKE